MKRLAVVLAVLVVACTVGPQAVHAMSCVEDRVEWVYLKQRETYSGWRDVRPREPFYNVVESPVRLTSIDAPAGPWTPWTPKTLAGGRYRYAEYSRTVQVDVVCPSTTTSSTAPPATTTTEVPPSSSTSIPSPGATTTSVAATTTVASPTSSTAPPAGGSSTTSTPPVSSSPSTTTAPPTDTSPPTTLRLCDGSAGPCELPATGLAAGTVVGLALALFIAGLGALAAACKGRSS